MHSQRKSEFKVCYSGWMDGRTELGLMDFLKASFWGLLGLIPENLVFLELKFFETNFLELTGGLLLYCWCLEF